MKKELTPEEFGKVMQPKDLVAVHVTDYFPENGKIKCRNSVDPDILRLTTHFSINHPVESMFYYGNWDKMNYAVIAPLEKLAEKNVMRNFNVVDTYFLGDVELPEESIVLDSRMLRPTQEQINELTKKGIRYGVSNNVREDATIVIENEGYQLMPGGMWNWGACGADSNDQIRIAEHFGAQYNIHANDGLKNIEQRSCIIGHLTRGIYSDDIKKYLELTQGKDLTPEERAFYIDSDNTRDIFLDGQRALEGLEQQTRVKVSEMKLCGKIPEDIKSRLEKFDNYVRGEVRKLVPVIVRKQYKIAA